MELWTLTYRLNPPAKLSVLLGKRVILCHKSVELIDWHGPYCEINQCLCMLRCSLYFGITTLNYLLGSCYNLIHVILHMFSRERQMKLGLVRI